VALTYFSGLFFGLQVPQINKMPFTLALMVTGSVVTSSWKLILSSPMHFHYNAISLDSLLPTISLSAIYFNRSNENLGNGILIASAVFIWLYNVYFFCRNISYVAKGIGIKIFSIKPKEE